MDWNILFILTTFDFIHRAMSNDLKDKKHSSELKTKMLHLENSYVNAYKPTKSSLRKQNFKKVTRKQRHCKIKTRQRMWNSNSRSRRICKKDIRYNQKFKLIFWSNHLKRRTAQWFLRTLKNKDFFTDQSYDKIYPSGCKPASIYGLPKIHKLNINKDNLSLRPIISSIGTYNYNLSKFLTNLLAPVIPITNCTKDSFAFCQEIRKR